MKSTATDHRSDPAPLTLIVGYGNPLRGDDALGCTVAYELMTGSPLPNVQVIRAHQLTPEIAEALSRADLAIFVDAACNSEPGKVTCRRIIPLPVRGESLGHHMAPEHLLAYAQVLYGHAPETSAITVGGEMWGYCQQLSPPVRAAVPEVLRRINELIAAGVHPLVTSPGA